MCSKPNARVTRETLGSAIDQFADAVEAMKVPLPKISRSARTLFAIADIYRGAAATVPLVRRKA